MRMYTLLALMLLVVSGPSSLTATPYGGPRVRASDRRILAAIADGTARSPTFRKVLARVEELDVIAYIEIQPQLAGHLAGALMWVTATKEFRYVRIGINPALSGGQLVATLAHELQHATEVGEAPWIVDEQSLSDYYRRVGVATSSAETSKIDQWETAAAQRTGVLVRREFAIATGTRVADSIQPLAASRASLTQNDK